MIYLAGFAASMSNGETPWIETGDAEHCAAEGRFELCASALIDGRAPAELEPIRPVIVECVARGLTRGSRNDVYFEYCPRNQDGLATLQIASLAASASTHDRVRITIDRRILELAFSLSVGPIMGDYHLSTELRAIVAAIRACHYGGREHPVYLRAKALELIALTTRHLSERYLVRLSNTGGLTQADCRSLALANQIIEDQSAVRWNVETLARAAGINRAKLVSHYPDMYGSTVGDAILARRMEIARQVLTTSDRCVAKVSYDVGYTNSASFARAFKRYFGCPPTALRSAALAGAQAIERV